MASILDAIKRAADAAKEIDRLAISTAQNPAPKKADTVSGKTNGEIAQIYARNTLVDSLQNPAKTSQTTAKSKTSSTASANAYNAYLTALAQQEQLYSQQQAQAQRHKDQQTQALNTQNNLIKQQLSANLDNTLAENNRSADKSLKEAYTAYMLSQRNLAQQLKALGISGGGSETVLADMENKYANNRFEIESQRGKANSAARTDYDKQINSAYIDYLSALAKINDEYNNRLYTLANQNSTALQSLAKAVK